MSASVHSPGLIEPRLALAGRESLSGWARWNTNFNRLYTLGVEDEVMLLQPCDWSLAQDADRVLQTVSPELARSMRPETHAAVVELVTGIHGDVSSALSEVRSLR